MSVSASLWPVTIPASPLWCRNHLSLYHIIFSLGGHLAAYLVRRQLNSKTQEIDYEESENLSKSSIMQHYVLVWLSILTSPRGLQLDFWLFVLVIMDLMPIVISIYQTVTYLVNNRLLYYDPYSVLWGLTTVMRSWSPAYQLNNWLMNYVDGCLIKHVYILFLVTISITQVHRTIVHSVYCYRGWIYNRWFQCFRIFISLLIYFLTGNYNTIVVHDAHKEYPNKLCYIN